MLVLEINSNQVGLEETRGWGCGDEGAQETYEVWPGCNSGYPLAVELTNEIRR